MEGLEELKEVELATPFGAPSRMRTSPACSPASAWSSCRATAAVTASARPRSTSRANVWGMKTLGVTRILSVSAVGSMREDVAPGDFVAVDQFIDRTRHRPDTFFERGVVAHVMFADPICADLRGRLVEARARARREGPRRRYLREHGGPAVLDARRVAPLPQLGRRRDRHDEPQEAQASRARPSSATRPSPWPRTTTAGTRCTRTSRSRRSLAVMARNVANAGTCCSTVIPRLGRERHLRLQDALKYAILTEPGRIPTETRDRLGLLLDRYLGRTAT